MTDKRQEHLGDYNRNFACFLPAISNFFNTFISNQRVLKAHIYQKKEFQKDLTEVLKG